MAAALYLYPTGMSLGQVALGVASLVMGVHHLRNGAQRLGMVRTGAFEGMTADRAMPAPVRVPGRAFYSSPRGNVVTPNGNRSMQMRSFNIRTLEDRIRYLKLLADEGKRDPQVYAFTRRALARRCGNGWCVAEKDNLGEARTLFGSMRRTLPPKMSPRDVATARTLFGRIRKNVRYTSDIAGVDTYQKPGHTLALRTGDCIPEGSLLLRQDGRLIPIESIQVEDVIFDGSRWAKVTNWWDKGTKEVRALSLNNGSVLRCTDGHKLFRIPRNGGAGNATDATEVLAQNVDIGDELLQPREMSFGVEGVEIPADEAFILGVYLAEGSVRRRRVDGTIATIALAGVAAGKGIREQVVEAAERAGFKVAPQDREVYLTDSGDRLHRLIHGCGTQAPEKKLLHVAWAPATAEHILRGLSADGGVATNGTNFVFSTTSPTLAVQYRVLQRLQGRSCSIKRVDEHGGLGDNPIYRVIVRKDNQRRPWAKVRSITQAASAHVYDIETDSHRFYLPEQDIVVHNCDDYSSLTCAGLQSIGIPCRYKVIRTKGAKDWNHIYAQAGFPRQNPKRWISMDSSVNMPFGWEAPPSMVAASRVFRVG